MFASLLIGNFSYLHIVPARDTTFNLDQSARSLLIKKNDLFESFLKTYALGSLRKDVMSQPAMDDQSQLCPSCSSIDFKSAFALPCRDPSVWGGVAITATRREVQADCVLCSCVVARIFSDFNTKKRVSAVRKIGYHFLALDSLWLSEAPNGLDYKGRDSDVVVVTVRGSPDQRMERQQLMKAISLGVIVPLAQRSALQFMDASHFYDEVPSQYYYRGRIVNSLSPDFTRIRSWIDECNSLQPNCHFKCKSLRGNMSFQSRVIDCWTRQIVPLTRDLEYLALSYVWGKATDDENSQTSQTSGVVSSPAPQTIEDAMSIVRGLEKRYLWVDRYCIWQSESRHLQIQNMHEIYRNALTTIVPIEADSAGSGFSGMSSPRCDQFRFWTNAGLLVFTLPHISYHLSSSIWLTRGWTYQETFLSRSCVFFTKDQAYFACRSNYQSEAVERVPMPFKDRHRETLGPQLLIRADYLDPYNGQSSSHLFFYEHVHAYTSRSLTLDSDGLNAFEGIIKSGNAKSFWGIVSYRSNNSELGFAVGLAWSGSRKPPGGGPIRRRKGFPTWSWVSLVDQIENPTRRIGPCRNILACSNFYAEDENRQTVGIADIYKHIAGSGALLFSNFGKTLFIEANITQVHLRWSKKAGVCFVHAPRSRKTGAPFSRVRVRGVRAWIDDEDAELLSNIESYPWSAVQLFWSKEEVAPQVQFGYWMLVDERESVVHRIGIIAPVPFVELAQGKTIRAEKTLINMGDNETNRRYTRMEDLKAQRRIIRIE